MAFNGICGNAACTVGGTLDDVGSSILVGGGVGYRFASRVRADVGVTYGPSYALDQADSGVPPSTYEVSGFTAISSGNAFKVLGGTKTGLACAVLAGAAVPVNDMLAVDIGYRLMSSSDLETAAGNYTLNGATVGSFNGIKGSVLTNEVTVGVRLNLGRR